jgi:hypothetical protein
VTVYGVQARLRAVEANLAADTTDPVTPAGKQATLDTVALLLQLPAPLITDSKRVQFTPWTDGFSVGFAVQHLDTGVVEYVYLTPSVGCLNAPAEELEANIGTVFLYAGPEGDPGQDSALTHVDALIPDLEQEDRSA